MNVYVAASFPSSRVSFHHIIGFLNVPQPGHLIVSQLLWPQIRPI